MAETIVPDKNFEEEALCLQEADEAGRTSGDGPEDVEGQEFDLDGK